MSKLLMLKGLPASGKSTYAKELADKGWIRVNKDDMRAMLNNGKWSKGNEKRVLKLRDQIISEALIDGLNVVVDDTNFAEYHKHKLYDLARHHGASFDEKFFDTPLQVCLNRDNKRANGVGKDVIMKMYNQYLRPKPSVYIPPDAPEAVLVDVDGTLAHMSSRSPYDWSKVKEDRVNDAVADLVVMLSKSGMKIVIMSGRDGVCLQDTKDWLRQNNIPFDYIYMRAEGDSRKDSIVKRELFDQHIRTQFDVRFVLDDRNQVVEMWREMGLPTFQVAEGDF